MLGDLNFNSRINSRIF